MTEATSRSAPISSKVSHGYFVKMFVTEGEKIYVECLVFIDSSFAKLKANTGSGASKKGQLFRSSSTRGVIIGHSWPFFCENVYFIFYLLF